ncbi:MAG: 2Fe-2S iron-sulfur cluster-binding protein [Acidimicrobiales bacterium]
MPVPLPRRALHVTLDGEAITAAEGDTLLDVCRKAGKDIPTLCYGETLTPRNACRVCMVELEGSRTLVPACSRPAEEGQVVHSQTERVNHSRKLVLELLGSSVDLSLAPDVARWNALYGADPARFGPPAEPAEPGQRDHLITGEHHQPHADHAATVAQPPKVDNPLYVRDYGRCILCYKCVDACGPQWQNTFAITAAGRGFDTRIATEFDVPLPESACVYCGNCIAVCPTGALLPTAEFELRLRGEWAPERQHETTTVCPYCGVGCNLTLHVQDNTIFKVSSPSDHSVTHGNLCIKGRFGYDHIQPNPPPTPD